jgi:Amt family ammonium transporter
MARAGWIAASGGLFLLATGAARAESGIDTGDTAWVLMSAALVMLMTPGLGLFYAGMVRAKNVLGTMMHSFTMVALVGVTWVLCGYSLAFGGDGALIGNLEWIGLRAVTGDPGPYADNIPHLAFMTFQGMFAIITPALISGAFAERMRFGAFLLFMLLWSTFVYSPICHWVWGSGGWLGKLGALDFAGGTVVHISSGVAALACALMLGRRKNLGSEEMAPHNLTMTIIGTALLWFGWFGFNAGSALGANGLAANAFVVTNTAAAAAALSWMLVETLHRGRPTALGAASGAVAGLVAITPAAGFVGPVSAVIIGFVVSFLSYGAILLKGRLGYDDALDVVAVHFVGGAWGALATGLFASLAINDAGADGLFFGGGLALLGRQFVGVAATAAFSLIASLVILLLVRVFIPLRVTDEDETVGLDLSQHGEMGYNLEAV